MPPTPNNLTTPRYVYTMEEILDRRTGKVVARNVKQKVADALLPHLNREDRLERAIKTAITLILASPHPNGNIAKYLQLALEERE